MTEYLDDLLSKKGTELSDYDIPVVNLFYIPFWVFEYHQGKKRGTGFLNASNSEIILDNKEFCNAIKSERVELDQLLTLEVYKLYKPQVITPKIIQESKALDLLNYKLPYLLDEKDKHFITEVDLVYLPIWEVSFKLDKDYKISIVATNKTALSGFDFLEGAIAGFKDKGNLTLFSNMVSEIKNPLNFFKYIGYIFLYLSKLIFEVISWFFKGKLVWLKLLLLIVVIAGFILLL